MVPAPPNPSGYAGEIIPIALGRTGLFTDAAQCDIPMSGLIKANNVTYYNQVVQKDYGSRIWNSSALPAGIARAIEMYPDQESQNQRIFALCKNGQVYKFYNNYTAPTQITRSTGSEPTNLDTAYFNSMVVGGNELLNNPKKLFIFDSAHVPQVISADATVRTSMSKPAADWTGSQYPFGGIIHRGALYCWGNHNNPHGIYGSSVTNHEDFQTGGSTFNYVVYPGDGDGIVGGCVFRNRLYVVKYPLGVYYLVDTDSNRANWYFAKQSDDFGGCSPQSLAIVLNDLFIANNYGSFTSLLASLVFGDTTASDIFHTQSCFRYAEENIRPDLNHVRSVVYYAKKQQVLCTFQSTIGAAPDRIAVIDFKNPQKTPRVSWTDKDQANCLFMVRNNLRVPKPFYGSNDGYLYEMDVPDRWVGAGGSGTPQTAYAFDIQTPHMDFSAVDVKLGVQNKAFDYIDVCYEPTGDWDVSIDVYIDQKFTKTYTCNLSGRSNLSEMPLNSSPVDGLGTFTRHIKIFGTGRTISLRFYNSGLGQDVRLVKAYIYYTLSAQQPTESK